MRRLFTSLRQQASYAWRGLWSLFTMLLLVGSAVIWSLSYQHKAPYTVDVGGLTDDAYVTGFNAKEETPELAYRWSSGLSQVAFPGVGNQPVRLVVALAGFRAGGDPPSVKLEARGQAFEVQTSAEPREFAFVVERGDRFQGDFELVISAPTFSPPGDARELGVLVDRVIIEPAGYGLRPFVVPPPSTMVTMLVAVLLCYVIVLATGQSRGAAVTVAGTLSVLVLVLIICARLELGLLARTAPGLMLWTLVLGIGARALLDLLLPHARIAVACGSAACALAFLLRFGGLIYPQFLTSDLLLHVHYVQSVLRGDLLFTGLLPDGTPVPYPPALYMLVAPLTGLFGTSDEAIGTLLKWLSSLLDASTCVALAWAGARIFGPLVGGAAALIYAVLPPVFELLSAGNYSNQFAQSVWNLTALGGLVYLAKGGGQAGLLVVLAASFLLTVLGHYGMMLSALVVMGLFGVLTGWTIARKVHGQGRSFHLLAAFSVALGASILLYYAQFAREIGGQFSGLFERLLGGGDRVSPESATPGGETLLARLGRKLNALVGTLPLVSGALGVLVPGRMEPAVRNLLAAWLGAAAFFFVLDQALGDAIRWYYLGAAPLALLAGRFFASLVMRPKSARLLTGLCVAAMLVQLLYHWVGDLIFTRYH